MSKLFDRESGQWMDVNDTDVTSLVGSGKFGFEKDVDIPVINPDGNLAYISSNQAEEAFRDHGYRWATYDDGIAQEQKSLQEADQARFGEGAALADAGIAGGLRGYTLGISDPLMIAAGDIAGKGEEVKEGLNKLRDYNPKISAASQVVGAIANPLIRGTGTSAMKAGEGVGASLAQTVTNPAARAIAEKIGSGAIGSAFEGAIYGIGDGISEAALGNPDEVAQNLLMGPALGGLIGGAFGSSFGVGKAAAPFIKKAAGKVISASDELVQTGLRKSAEIGAVPALSLAGEKEVAQIVKGLIPEAEARALYMSGGAEKLTEAVRQVNKMTGALNAEAKTLRSQLTDYVKAAPKQARDAINKAVDSAGGNLQKALKDTYATYEGSMAALSQHFRETATNPAIFPTKVVGAFDSAFQRLMDSGDKKAARLADDVRSWFSAQLASRPATEGESALLMRELRDRVSATTARLPKDLKEPFIGLGNQLTKELHSHPVFGTALKEVDQTRTAYDKLREFTTGVKKDSVTTPKKSLINNIINDPEKARDLDTLLSNIADFAPDIDRLQAAGKDLVKRQNALRQLSSRLDQFRDKGLSRSITTDDLDELVQAINPKSNMSGKIERLRQIQNTLQQSTDSTVTKYMNVSKALGQPISKDLAELLKHETQFANLERLKKFSKDDNEFDVASAIVRNMLGRAGLGSAVGGYLGGTEGAIAGGVVGAAANPYNAIKTLTRLERLSHQSHRLLDKAVTRAVDSLTTRSILTTTGAATAPHVGKSLKERRETFKKRAEELNKLRDPNQMAAAIEDKIGSDVDIPQISAAVGAQFGKTAMYLADKLPIDPLAHMSLMANKSTWEPSDFELARFERYVDAAENPLNVIEEISTGSVSPEGVETLQTLYPTAFKQLQERTLDAIMDTNESLTYDQRVQIGTLFDMPVDPTLNANFIATMQQNVAQQSSPTGGPSAGPSQKPIHIQINPQAMQTEAQRITYKV